MGNHSASAPSRRIIPATPRNDAADRYSPEIALALATGPTVRDATRKSDVLRATRTPSEPMIADAAATSPIATSATIPEVPMVTALVLHVIGEVLLDAVRDAAVEPRDGDEERVHQHPEQQPRHAHTQQVE